LEPGPDSYLVCYSIPDRASHIPPEAFVPLTAMPVSIDLCASLWA
jgi:hypothetical protein